MVRRIGLATEIETPERILEEIAECRLCAAHLPHPPRPVLAAGRAARLLIVGQAPGRRVNESGVPWSDASGATLRSWLQMSEAEFYDTGRVAILPMGFCYPGKGASGDLPPRPECAPRWHPRLLAAMPQVRLMLLVGSYAQAAYLGDRARRNLTDNVAHFAGFLPRFFPLPHPSPRNRFWLSRHPWFEQEVLPALREKVRQALQDDAGAGLSL